MRQFLLWFVLLIGLAITAAQAQQTVPPPPSSPPPPPTVDLTKHRQKPPMTDEQRALLEQRLDAQWSRMTLEGKQNVLRLHRALTQMPPDERKFIHDRIERFLNMTPAERQRLRQNTLRWEQMTPEQRTYVRQTVLPHWQQLPPARRQAILQRLHSLRDLNESDRQSKLNDPAFTQGMSGEDREMLQQLAHLHVGMAADGPGL